MKVGPRGAVAELTLHWTPRGYRPRKAVRVDVAKGAEANIGISTVCGLGFLVPRRVMNAVRLLQGVGKLSHKEATSLANAANMEAHDPTEKRPMSPLLAACFDKDLARVKWLIGLGARANATLVTTGDTALHLALWGPPNADRAPQGIALVEALIRAGASLDAGNEFGERPLHTAIQEWSHYLDRATISAPHRNPYNLNLEKLIQAGADCMALNGRDESPLWAAAHQHNTRALDLLLACQLSRSGREATAKAIALVDVTGTTVFHRALNSHHSFSYLVTAAKALLKQSKHRQFHPDNAYFEGYPKCLAGLEEHF